MVRAMTQIAIHLVVGDPDQAASWYAEAFGARETSRLTLPGGRTLTVELLLGDTVLAVAGEMPERGMRTPAALGGTPAALHVEVSDADAAAARALRLFFVRRPCGRAKKNRPREAAGFSEVHEVLSDQRSWPEPEQQRSKPGSAPAARPPPSTAGAGTLKGASAPSPLTRGPRSSGTARRCGTDGLRVTSG